jgi:hypothetical protein
MQPLDGPLPNFFIVGAPKAGTTSLYYYLDQHPEVYMSPIKEPCYFASEIRPENFSDEYQDQVRSDLQSLRKYLDGPMRERHPGGMVLEWEQYCRLFRDAREARAIGEASVAYLWSESAAANIAAEIPRARILMVLRDPAERAFSQYLHMLTGGIVGRPFRDQVEAGLRGGRHRFGPAYPFLEFGLYYEQVRRFLEHFPRERVQICLYEDYRGRQAEILAGIFRFLEVSPEFSPDTSEKHRQARVPRSLAGGYILKRLGIWQAARRLCPPAWMPKLRAAALRPPRAVAMEPRERQVLVEYYRHDVCKLEGLLNRDLGAWLKV